MPRKKNKNVKTVTVVTCPTMVTGQNKVSKSKKKNRSGTSGRGRRLGTSDSSLWGPSSGSITQSSIGPNSYRDLLNDPFNYPPSRLGLGCMIPTDLWVATRRFQVTASSTDGSFAVVVLPFVGATTNSILATTSAGTSTSPVWGANSFSNGTNISDGATEARVIACGVRCYPNIALTVAPGFIYAGGLTPVSYATVASSVITGSGGLIDNPYLKNSSAALGAQAFSRPIDFSSFLFSATTINGSTTILPTSSMPTIVGNGGPASAVWQVDVIMHLEAYSTINDNISTINIGNEYAGNTSPTLADYFPSLDSMWNYTKRGLRAAYSFMADDSSDFGVTGSVSRMQALAAGGAAAATYVGYQGRRRLMS